jgi:hypothetical protein
MDYKILFIPAMGREEQFEKEYETHQQAEIALDAIANYTLLLHDHDLMADYSNCGMVLERVGDDWIEIDGDGNEL